MGDRTGYAAAPMPEYNFIDKAVNAKLIQQKIQPSDECTDADFVRRVYLDLTGIVPTGEVARAFVEDTTPSPQKRHTLVDQAGRQPRFCRLLVQQMGGSAAMQLPRRSAKMASGFSANGSANRVAQNKPYDQFVRELITAEGSSNTNPAVNYFRTLRDTGKITEDVSQTFLGVRFNCNKCHDHPFERWTQEQYYQFGAFFARVAFKPGSAPGEEIVYNNVRRRRSRSPQDRQGRRPDGSLWRRAGRDACPLARRMPLPNGSPARTIRYLPARTSTASGATSLAVGSSIRWMTFALRTRRSTRSCSMP